MNEIERNHHILQVKLTSYTLGYALAQTQFQGTQAQNQGTQAKDQRTQMQNQGTQAHNQETQVKKCNALEKQ